MRRHQWHAQLVPTPSMVRTVASPSVPPSMARAFESHAIIDEDRILFPLKAMFAPMAWSCIQLEAIPTPKPSTEAGPQQRHGKDLDLEEGQARR
jgi:hypothetical protein